MNEESIRAADIKEKIVGLLKTKYPGYKTYGIEVSEGYKRPSFFVDIRLNTLKDGTINIVEKEFRVHIVYFQEKVDENDIYKKVDEISEAFLISTSKKNKKEKYVVEINNRFIPVSDFTYDYTGKDGNVLYIDFSLRFYDWRNVQGSDPVMEDLDMSNITAKEE